jgi:glucosamine kinase
MIAVGVDAGGSGSQAVVVRDGVVVARRDLGPINVLLHADAVDRLAGAVTDAGAAAAGFGLAGLRSAQHARELTAELARRTGARVVVGDDTDAALAGAFAGRPGIVVIAGTGSGAAGRDAAGRTVRVGGHGFLLGDEGGGYWIGREAVRAALRAADGTGPATALTAVVQRAFGSLAGAETEVHLYPTERGLLSRLVPDVAALAAGTAAAAGTAGTAAAAGTPAAAAAGTARTAAAAGTVGAAGTAGTAAGGPGGRSDGGIDAEAARILTEAAAYLAELAHAVRARLGDLPVAGVGGIFRCAPVREAFRAATGAAEPVEPPELGALRLLDRA